MNETAVVKTEDKPMEFIPFGGQDKIKLSVAIVQNLICVKTKSGKTCSANDAIKFMMMCQARRLNPFESDAYLIGYDGKDGPTFSLITAHQAFLKRAEVNPEYDGMKSGIIVKQNDELKDLEGDFYTEGQAVVGGWATVYFKNREHPMHKRVRLSRFQKSFGVWQDDGAGMICKCAEADALRSSFPTMLGGLYLKEETAIQVAAPSKPIFTKSETLPVDTAPAKPVQLKSAKKVDPKPEPATGPEVQGESEAEEPPTYNIRKAVKGLIREAGLKDTDVLKALVEIGTIEADVESLDDVDEDTINLLHEQHQDIFDKIKEAK